MDDQLPMRVLHRLAHRPEQPQPLVDGRDARATEVGERLARDILHGEPGRAVGEHVRVVERRDRRMVQLRERSLLGGEPAARAGDSTRRAGT